MTTSNQRHGRHLAKWPFIILFTVFPLVCPFGGQADTIYVPNDHRTIQSAIDAASDGDTIVVRSGRYIENLVLDKPLFLEGVGGPIVDGNGNGTVILVTASNCGIDGIKVVGSGEGWPDAGVRIEGNNVAVTNVIAEGNKYGVMYLSTTGGEVTDSYVSQNDELGILLDNSSQCRVHNNEIVGNLEGIHAAYSQDIDIYGNTVRENSQYGIIVRESNNVQVFDNTASKNGVNGLLIGDSTGCSVYGNVVQGNGFYGIALSNTSLTSVFENDFSYNEGEAIHLSHSATRNEIRANEVAHNVTGIAIHDSSNNAIHHNVLKDNDSQAYDNSVNEWDDGAEGNCWSDYVGLDENKDRIGDTPYDIPGGNNKDRYPLMATSPGVQGPLEVSFVDEWFGLANTAVFTISNPGPHYVYVPHSSIKVLGVRSDEEIETMISPTGWLPQAIITAKSMYGQIQPFVTPLAVVLNPPTSAIEFAATFGPMIFEYETGMDPDPVKLFLDAFDHLLNDDEKGAQILFTECLVYCSDPTKDRHRPLPFIDVPGCDDPYHPELPCRCSWPCYWGTGNYALYKEKYGLPKSKSTPAYILPPDHALIIKIRYGKDENIIWGKLGLEISEYQALRTTYTTGGTHNMWETLCYIYGETPIEHPGTEFAYYQLKYRHSE